MYLDLLAKLRKKLKKASFFWKFRIMALVKIKIKEYNIFEVLLFKIQ